jgi:hypothetical protein
VYAQAVVRATVRREGVSTSDSASASLLANDPWNDTDCHTVELLPGLVDRWDTCASALCRQTPEPGIMAVSSFVITIDGEEVQRFSSYGQEAPRAPPLLEPGSDADKFSFEYTGRHDDGDLLPPRSGGAHETALNAILVSSTLDVLQRQAINACC